MFCVDACPGGSGEPVLLLHGLVLGPQSARYGGGDTLASSLAAAGFRVYCAAHRGDRDAFGGTEVHLDGVLEHDLPAALAAIAEDTGFARAHVVGHGLGGQLAMMLATRADVASVTAIAAPVRFRTPRSQVLAAHRMLSLLPPHWHLPTQTLARLSSPWLDESASLGDHVAPGATPPERLRGALHHTSDDLALGILDQLGVWVEENSLTSRDGGLDYVEALVSATAPLHLVHAPGDRLGHAASPDAVIARWRGVVTRRDLPESLARLDCLLGEDAPEQVFTPVVSWLDEHRRRAW